MKFFAKNIKHLRKSAGYNQSDLASLLKVRPNTISNYENSVSEPDIDQLSQLIKIFDISVNDLLFTDLESGVKKEIKSDYEDCALCTQKDHTIDIMQMTIDILKDQNERLKNDLDDARGKPVKNIG